MTEKRLPLLQRPRVYLDVETSGLDLTKHEIIEIAFIIENMWHAGHGSRMLAGVMATPFGKGGVSDNSEYLYWSTKIKPRHIETGEPEALKLNGYTDNPSAWDDAPYFEDVAPLIESLIDRVILVAHNAPFDVKFLRAAFVQAELEDPDPHRIVNTVTLAYEHLVPCGLQTVGLRAVLEFLDMPVPAGLHTALIDAIAVRAIHHELDRAGSLRRLWWRLRHKLRSTARPIKLSEAP